MTLFHRMFTRTLVQFKERNLEMITKYQQMTPKQRSQWIPEPRGNRFLIFKI